MADEAEEMVEVEDFGLDQALAEPEKEPEPEQSTEVKAEETEESTEESKEETKEETTESVDESPSDSDKTVPLAGLLDERDKRQQAERDRDELKAQLAEREAETEKRPSVFDDEEKAFSTIEERQAAERLNDKFELSRDFMGMIKDDYLDREAEFMTLAKEDTTLQKQLREHPNPARFAYETAVRHAELKEMENLPETKEKLQAEWREELKEELRKELSEEADKDKSKRDAITPSLADQRSVGGNDDVVTEDQKVDDILEN